MQNVNPSLLEYGILALGLIGVILLMALKIMTTTDGTPIITGIILYGVGSAKGAATVNAIMSTVPGPTVPGSMGASNPAPLTK